MSDNTLILSTSYNHSRIVCRVPALDDILIDCRPDHESIHDTLNEAPGQCLYAIDVYTIKDFNKRPRTPSLSLVPDEAAALCRGLMAALESIGEPLPGVRP